ncbi:hypothetical protein ACWDZ4_08335 [Streptomyces sp. NPDC003016]
MTFPWGQENVTRTGADGDTLVVGDRAVRAGIGRGGGSRSLGRVGGKVAGRRPEGSLPPKRAAARAVQGRTARHPLEVVLHAGQHRGEQHRAEDGQAAAGHQQDGGQPAAHGRRGTVVTGGRAAGAGVAALQGARREGGAARRTGPVARRRRRTGA